MECYSIESKMKFILNSHEILFSRNKIFQILDLTFVLLLIISLILKEIYYLIQSS